MSFASEAKLVAVCLRWIQAHPRTDVRREHFRDRQNAPTAHDWVLFVIAPVRPGQVRYGLT